MKYKTISPLGERDGFATFDTFWNNEKYFLKEDALVANDIVFANFVEDEQSIKYVELYHMSYEHDKVLHRLEIQNFPFGVDCMDDTQICELAAELINRYK